MMHKLVLLCCVIVSAVALPVGNEILDKATVHDVYANDVAAPVKLEDIADVHRSGESTTVVTTAKLPEITPQIAVQAGGDVQFKPQHATTMFARLIDDIFQIPITVLQSVAKLLTNPFKQPAHATPEATSTY